MVARSGRDIGEHRIGAVIPSSSPGQHFDRLPADRYRAGTDGNRTADDRLGQGLALFEQLAKLAVIISLFTAGLQLRLPLRSVEWRISRRLATAVMALTVMLITAIAVTAFGFPVGAAVILGAVLAPTDPVFASDVQLEKSTDRDRLRFVLTGEAGFNDGTAFSFVMLGLGILGVHDIGDYGWRWWAIDLVWAVAAGLAIGAGMGTIVGKLVLYLRQSHREAVGLDNFLAVGLIGLSYGAALYAAAYGFLAVFAAGVALRRVERMANVAPPDEALSEVSVDVDANEVATEQETAPAYMAEAVLHFNSQLERFAEVAMVVAIGAMLNANMLSLQSMVLVLMLLLIGRPLAVFIGLIGLPMTRPERSLAAWFGIRGVGSIYYLCYAVEHDLPLEFVGPIVDMTLLAVATSILLHGVSVTPLMKWYSRTVKAVA